MTIPNPPRLARPASAAPSDARKYREVRIVLPARPEDEPSSPSPVVASDVRNTVQGDKRVPESIDEPESKRRW
jgi:hypothetical protein